MLTTLETGEETIQIAASSGSGYLLGPLRKNGRGMEEERARTPLYLVLIPTFTFPVRYAWTERLKGGKDEKEGVREGVLGVEGERESDQRRWRDRLSCQAAVNSHRRDVEAGDFFCTSPLICASDYLNWLEQS